MDFEGGAYPLPDPMPDLNDCSATPGPKKPRFPGAQLYDAIFDPPAQFLVDAGVHPNSVTAAGVPLQFSGLALHSLGGLGPAVGGMVLVFGSALADILDGKVSHLGGRRDPDGGIFDAFTDKLKNIPTYMYLAGCLQSENLPADIAFTVLAITLSVSHVISQSNRPGSLLEQSRTVMRCVFDPRDDGKLEEQKGQAKYAGKLKTWLEYGGIFSVMLSTATTPLLMWVAVSFLAAAQVSAVKSIRG